MAGATVNKCTYIILLNWKGWRDTIACLETIFASDIPDFRVVVCDNASDDGSLSRIAAWADGDQRAQVPETARLAQLFGNVKRRPRWQRLQREAAESGRIDPQADLFLVDNGENLGFAAGNNVGLRLALSQGDMDCIWLLNNDTLVEPGCLREMRQRLAAQNDRAVCGSMIHFFDRPDVIQAVGGNRFNRYTGVAACSEGRFVHESEAPCAAEVEGVLDYVSGCSMLVPRAYLEEVGLLGEDYFLYYEEIDWFTRNAGRYPIVIAPKARLYHREGSAIGSSGWQRAASSFADGHLYRSRLLYMRKYYRRWIPLCYLASLMQVGKKLWQGHWANAQVVLAVLAGRADLRTPG